MAGISDGMRTFAQRYNIAINDPDLKALYRMEQDALHEEASLLWSAEKRGADTANRSNAKRMRMKGYPVSNIAEITGLSISEISNL